MKNVSRLLLPVILLILPVLSYAQGSDSLRHKRSKKHPHTETKKQLTPEEKKKENLKRTLKEKNFHLPDTSRRNKSLK